MSFTGKDGAELLENPRVFAQRLEQTLNQAGLPELVKGIQILDQADKPMAFNVHRPMDCLFEDSPGPIHAEAVQANPERTLLHMACVDIPRMRAVLGRASQGMPPEESDIQIMRHFPQNNARMQSALQRITGQHAKRFKKDERHILREALKSAEEIVLATVDQRDFRNLLTRFIGFLNTHPRTAVTGSVNGHASLKDSCTLT